MRKVVSYLIYSLDGIVSDPQDWIFDRFDDEMMGHLASLIQDQDTVLMGRTTYEEWASYWPTSTHEPFASFINRTPKVVASTTLNEVEWDGTTVIRDVAKDVARLKDQPGRDIGVHGSATLVRSLIQGDLLDELRLALFPAIAGGGQHALAGIEPARNLDLIDVERTGEGVLFLTYAPRALG